jgi:hypothetical protein
MNEKKSNPLKTQAMEKLMIAGLIALFSLMLINPGTPWITPSENNPEPVGPTLENPIHNNGGNTGTTLLR